MPWVIFAAAMGGAGVHGAIRSATADRLDDLHLERDHAQHAVVTAARADARRWAPEAWDSLEDARRAAVTSMGRADGAYWWFSRDLSVARQDLLRVNDLARAAAEAARHREAEAGSIAREAVAAAETAVDAAVRVRPLLVDGAQQLRTARARLLLDDARRQARAGDHFAATDRATRAVALATAASRSAVDAAARFDDPAQIETWRRWTERAVTWSRETGRTAIVISKVERRLTLYVRGVVHASFSVDLSRNWFVQKLSAGDLAVPEGRYHIVAMKDRGASLYHKALLLDYPNDADRLAFRAARRAGRLPESATVGGLIEIHGHGGRGEDWTNGCVALADADIDALFALVQVGTPVTIVGSTRARGPMDLVAAGAAEARQ